MSLTKNAFAVVGREIENKTEEPEGRKNNRLRYRTNQPQKISTFFVSKRGGQRLAGERVREQRSEDGPAHSVEKKKKRKRRQKIGEERYSAIWGRRKGIRKRTRHTIRILHLKKERSKEKKREARKDYFRKKNFGLWEEEIDYLFLWPIERVEKGLRTN